MAHKPPALRSPKGYEMAASAAADTLTLQQCTGCAEFQYPPRELCRQCLCSELNWKQVPTGGELLARSELQHSLEPYFLERMPWTLASVKLDCGPVVLAWLTPDCPKGITRVAVSHHLQADGSSILQASPTVAEHL